jgi:hypothetical protein
LSLFHQKATTLASTMFFNKRIPRPSRTRLTRRSGGLKPASSETAKRESASRPPLLAKPRNLFAVSVKLRGRTATARASDILWTLNHPDVYQLLVRVRGWTPRRYERWLADITCSQLLR